MINSEYKLKILDDYSKLDEIHKLAHNAFVEANLISKRQDLKLNLFPNLNEIHETKTIIAESNGQIIGTNSLTIDGNYGLHSDKYFAEETNIIRKEDINKVIGSSWRIATHKDYRSNIKLLLDLIQKSVNLAIDMKIETCLYIFAKKHENFYQKLLNAKVIKEKTCNIDPNLNVQLVLMKTDTKETIKHLNKLFLRRKF